MKQCSDLKHSTFFSASGQAIWGNILFEFDCIGPDRREGRYTKVENGIFPRIALIIIHSAQCNHSGVKSSRSSLLLSHSRLEKYGCNSVDVWDVGTFASS